MLIVASVVGAGIFFTPGRVAALLPDGRFILLAWAAGALARCRAVFGDPEGALHAAREAVEAGERVGSRVRAAAYHALAQAHAAAGEWSRARDAAARPNRT